MDDRRTKGGGHSFVTIHWRGSVQLSFKRDGSHIRDQLPQCGCHAVPMRTGSDPNAMPPAICRRLPVIRQLSNLTLQRPN